MRSGLSAKILLPVLATISLGLVAILLVFYHNARGVVQQELTKRLQREAQLTARMLDNWLQARMTDVVSWSRQQVLAEALTEEGYYGRSAREGAKQLLDSLQTGYPFYEGIFLADKQGAVVASSSAEGDIVSRIHLGDRPYFQEAMHGKTVVSSVLVSRFTGKKIFTIATPIAARGELVGVIAAVVDFSEFKALFLDSFRLKQFGYAFISDSRLQVLASSKDNEPLLAEEKHRGYLQRLFGGDSGNFVHSMDNVKTLTVFHRLHWADWSFTLNQSLEDTLLPLLQMGRVSALGAAIVLLFIAVAVSALFHRVMSERLRAMLVVIGKVKSGDLTQRIAQSAGRADEITELTDSFNAMIGQLDRTLIDLNQEIRMRRNSEAALAHHQENLEKIIAQRGAELKKEIQERQRAEERLVRAEKLEMIGTLAGGVAHDLNNILSGIVSYPDLLLLKVPPESPLRKALQTIKQSGEKASAIVQDLLTLARRGVAVKEPVNLNHLVQQYLDSPEFGLLLIHHPGIEVVTDCADDLRNILGSPVHLAKTIMNLVTNAAESMRHGGTIRIHTENRSVDNSLRLYEKIGQGEYVVLEVADQGDGINPEDLDKIFEPFYTSKKMGKSGTGLGMAVVWGTVKDHQGLIDCESTPGAGTTFTLYFPATHEVHRRQARVATPAEYQGRGEHILVVDDVAEQREIAASILIELGYRVSVAASGEEALALGARERFDLLLLDMILGAGMDGLDIYRQFLELVPAQKAIITSGFSETERVAEAIRLGAGAYVKKPYAIASLGRVLREVLARA